MPFYRTVSDDDIEQAITRISTEMWAHGRYCGIRQLLKGGCRGSNERVLRIRASMICRGVLVPPVKLESSKHVWYEAKQGPKPEPKKVEPIDPRHPEVGCYFRAWTRLATLRRPHESAHTERSL